MTLLQVKQTTKDFPIKGGFFAKEKSMKRAVNDVSFEVQQGEHFCLVGESGCGKTTLARMMMKLYPVTSGQILFQGHDIKQYAQRDYAKQVQMVFQDPYSSLDPRFSIKGILNEALLTQGMSSLQKEERMVQVLDQVGLNAEALSRYPHEFSGGERQRIAIARALLFEPSLLILDEAVSSLDVLVQKQIMDLLQELQEKFNLTYISISHNLRIVKRYCHRVAVMRQGRIVEQGDKDKIFNAPQHDYTKKLLMAALYYRVEHEPK